MFFSKIGKSIVNLNIFLARFKPLLITLAVILLISAVAVNATGVLYIMAHPASVAHSTNTNECPTSPGTVLDFMSFKNMSIGSYTPLGSVGNYCGYSFPVTEQHPNGTVHVWENAIIVVQSIVRWPDTYGMSIEADNKVDTVQIKEYADITKSSRLWSVTPTTVYIFIPWQSSGLDQCAVINQNNIWWQYADVLVSNNGVCHFKQGSVVQEAQKVAL